MLARQSNDVLFCVNKKFSIHTILLNLFFISGVCALISKVVWGRMLTLVMGQMEGVQCIR